MKEYINGPINCVRLEGQIDNINKILYVFFDVHIPVQYQTECTDIRAIEFKNYLIKNFDMAAKNNINIDFFLEMYTIYGVFDDKYHKHYKYKKIYLANIRKFFKQNFNFDRKANKIYESKHFPAVRLHYIDFRDLFIYDILFYKLPDIMNYFDNYFWNRKFFNKENIIHLKNEINYIDQRILFLKGFILDGKKIKGDKNSNIKVFEKIINKILGAYENNDIKNTLKKYFLDTFAKYFNNYEKIINDMLEYFNELEKIVNDNNKLNDNNLYGQDISANVKIYLPKIWKMLDDLELIIYNISSFIIDIYFLRRLLDKKYISNSLVYTGAHHSCAYIFVLIKYFNFKITHSSYQKIKSSKIEQICKKVMILLI